MLDEMAVRAPPGCQSTPRHPPSTLVAWSGRSPRSHRIWWVEWTVATYKWLLRGFVNAKPPKKFYGLNIKII